MNNIPFVLTVKEYELLVSYIKKNKQLSQKVAILNPTECFKSFSESVVLPAVTFSIKLDCIQNAELFIKAKGSHIASGDPSNKEILLGRDKLYLKSKGEYTKLITDKELMLVLTKIHEIMDVRELSSNPSLMVDINKFIKECDALLDRHFYIDKDIDSLNSSSDAVFNYCAGLNCKGIKQKYWVEYLNSNEKKLRLSQDILCDLQAVISKNEALFNDELQTLRLGYANREQCLKIAALIESAKFNSSVSIKRDFLNQNEIKCLVGDSFQATGILFGINQTIKNDRALFSIKFKTEENDLIEIESHSEFFGGLITKDELKKCINNELIVNVSGVVSSIKTGITIGGKVIFPSSIAVKAEHIFIDNRNKFVTEISPVLRRQI